MSIRSKAAPASRLFAACLSAVMVCACSGFQHSPERVAANFGFNKQVLEGESFKHVVFESALGQGDGEVLHIYIEGDGTPWKYGRFPAKDPTPRRTLALELMAKDTSPAIYIGRPCYFGLADDPGCEPAMWTSRRYSPEVIDSMAAVIRQYRRGVPSGKTVLIGYSGGGTIAALLAPKLSGERYLLTVAANLDIDLWTTQFGLLPLEGSVNPVHQLEQLRPISQFHLMGELDTTVPNNVTSSFTAQLRPPRSRLYPKFDHSCCWVDIWESVLAEKPWLERTETN